MGANDKVEATFHPGQAPRAEDNPLIMAIEALERMSDYLMDATDESVHDSIQEDYELVRTQLERVRVLEEDLRQNERALAADHRGGW
jgi:hypothetical protein